MKKNDLQKEVERLTDALSDANGDIETLEQRNRELVEALKKDIKIIREDIKDYKLSYGESGHMESITTQLNYMEERLIKHSAPAGQKGGEDGKGK